MRLTERTTHFVPVLILIVALSVAASLPGDDLYEVQTGPESPLLRFLLSDPFVHFLTFPFLTVLVSIGFSLESEPFLAEAQALEVVHDKNVS